MFNLVDLYQRLFGKNHIQDGTVIDMSEHGRIGAVSTGQPFKFVQSIDNQGIVSGAAQSVKLTTSGSSVYVGLATTGATTSAAIWQAMCWDGSQLKYADGNDNYDNVATDLTSLTYI